MKTNLCLKCGRRINKGFLGNGCRKNSFVGVDENKANRSKRSFEREVSKAFKNGVSVIYDFDIQDLNIVTVHKYANEIDRDLIINRVGYLFYKTLFYSSDEKTQKELISKWEKKFK